jgi:hypothetical protein
MDRGHHHRGRTLAIAVILAFAAALLLARPAHAGSYVVTECSSVSAGAPDATWERSSDHYRARPRCGTDDGLQVYHEAPETGLWHYGAWVWRAPAGTVFTSVQANASLTNRAGHRGQLIATRPSGEPVEFGAEHQDFRVHSIAGEFVQFHSWLRCVGGQPCGRAGDDGAHAYVRGIYLRTEDRVAPAISLSGGSLLGDPVVRGVRGLAFEATDVGGGIRRVWVEAGGAELVTDVRNCALAAGFATALRPCPDATSESAAVPTAAQAFATGPNAVRACAEDLGLDGAPNRTCEQLVVWVDNACPSSPVAGAGPLSAGFAGGGDSTVRSDRSATIRGRLAGAGAGATVCALTRDRVAGAPVVVSAVASTSADGSYAIALPRGPSRDIFVHHAVGDTVIARHGLGVRSIARPSFDVDPRAGLKNGDRLWFAGALPQPACAERLVKIQARLGKRRWQAFRTDRTDTDCRFAARYKLRATRRANRYRFRTLVPQQAGYPFERGRSRVVKVKVKRRR